jgi:spore coat polysaccharide biosynthesis protein SpsF
VSVLAVIQARMSSRRLPGKVLAEVCGVPLLAFLLRRLRGASTIDQCLVATSTLPADDAVASCAREESTPTVRGPLDDVLARYILALERHPAYVVIRVTADNPLTDPDSLDGSVRLLKSGHYDYVHSPEAIVGTAVDVFASDALRRCDERSRDPAEREHINEHVLNNPGDFRIGVFHPDPEFRRPDLSVTVDTPDELARVRSIVAKAGPRANLRQIIAILDREEAQS